MCRTPPLPSLYRRPARVRVGAGRPLACPPSWSPTRTPPWAPFLKGWSRPLVQLGLGRPPLALAGLAHLGPRWCGTPCGGCTPLVHVGPIQYVVPLLELSRTFQNLPVPCKQFPELFRNLRKQLSIYESYSPDSFGTSHDVRDPIRDSESPFVHFII